VSNSQDLPENDYRFSEGVDLWRILAVPEMEHWEPVNETSKTGLCDMTKTEDDAVVKHGHERKSCLNLAT